MSPYVVPDHLLERNFRTTLTPTFWASLTIIPFDSLGPPQSKLVASDEDGVPVKSSTSSDEFVNAKTPLSKSADLPHVQHNRFVFEDGNVTFLVEGILYRLHRYLFCRHSNELKDLLSRLPDEEESSSPPVIPLDDVKSVDFDALLSILYPQNYNTLEERSFEEWTSILKLSTRWGFTSIRDLAIRCIKPPSALQRLVVARKYDIEQWIVPALVGLCERPEPLSLNEASLLDLEDFVLVGSVRESVRSSNLVVRGAGIRDHILTWKGELESPPSPVSDSPGTLTPPVPQPPSADLQLERPPRTVSDSPGTLTAPAPQPPSADLQLERPPRTGSDSLGTLTAPAPQPPPADLQLERPPRTVSDSPGTPIARQPSSAALLSNHVQQGFASPSSFSGFTRRISMYSGTVDPPTNSAAGDDIQSSSHSKKKGKKGK